jgi:glycosyltransferase involved in cell wall biosynthesis
MISVIIPVFDQAEKLKYCLESIFKQSYKRLEIIVVDDGSKDKSGEAAAAFKDGFSAQGINLKIIKQENKGAPAARNHGLRAARGDFVLFCDADAVLEPNCLWEMINALRNNQGASFAYSSFYWGRKLFKLAPFDGKKLRQMPYIHTISLIKYKDFPVTGWDESLKRFQDWDLWLTMLEENHAGVWINKPLFRVCPGGTMSGWLPSFAYKFFPFLPAVKKYREAVKIIKEKHGLLPPEKEKA